MVAQERTPMRCFAGECRSLFEVPTDLVTSGLGQRHQTRFMEFGLADLQYGAVCLNILDLQPQKLSGAQAGGVEKDNCHTSRSAT